jgi:predicted unusual protein kinase regulating ubiquinone biosynthesis (AarF/ABC1/UbiB family)
MLITNDNRLGLFDLGMIAHVPPRQRERLLKLLFACVDGRGEEAANESIAMGTRLEDFDHERYVREIGQLVARYAAHAGSQAMSEGRLVIELVRIATACGLRTPPELSLLGKTLLNLEQVSFALDPTLDVKSIVESHIQRVMRERMRAVLLARQRRRRDARSAGAAARVAAQGLRHPVAALGEPADRAHRRAG